MYIFRSKTINFNAIYLAVIAILTEGMGYSIDPALIAAVQTIMNFILRAVTNKPLKDK